MAESDFSPDENAQRQAESLASNTANFLRRLVSGENVERGINLVQTNARILGLDVPLNDVDFVVNKFASQLSLASAFSGRIACVQIDDGEGHPTVPISTSFTWPYGNELTLNPRDLRRLWGSPPWLRFEAFGELSLSANGGEEIRQEPPEKAIELFQVGLTNFLSYRIAGFQKWLGRGPKLPHGSAGRTSSAPKHFTGLTVELTCTSPGLTIEFSHAYFIHFLNFGAPSFPVKNSLLAGRYVFQGSGPIFPGGTPRSQVFRVPPDFHAVTTRF